MRINTKAVRPPKSIIAFFLALIICSLISLPTNGDARDGLRRWWKAKDLNGDGLLQANELYDVMTVSAATPLTASEIKQNTDSPMAVPVSIGTGVGYASMRKTAPGDTYFALNNPTNYVDGSLVANWQSITLPKAASLPVDANRFAGTVIARIKWHGRRVKRNGYAYNYWVMFWELYS